MALFENKKKNEKRKVKKSPAKPSKVKKVKKVKKPRRVKEPVESVRTVVEVKTVGDIPPIIEARKSLGNGDIRKAANEGYKTVKKDYLRFFNETTNPSDSNRYFLINSMKKLGINVHESAYVDNTAILRALESEPEIPEGSDNKFNALRKLAYFYLNYYEKARFSEDMGVDGEEIVEKLSDIYDYMDIMKLYFPDVQIRKESSNEQSDR